MKDQKNYIVLWLYVCCAFIFTIVIVGAITRLTNSGLSMVEWRPLLGALPPMNDAEWERVFSLYKDSPEFQKKHFWMDMSEFKQIFFWEWFHRLLGRAIGLIYALPLLFFWVRGMIPKGYKIPLASFLVLGGLQGLMGWYMVQSGLVDDPYVSHYRLAAHLSLAFVLFSCLFWTAQTLRPLKCFPSKPLFVHGVVVMAVLVVTILWGAFTAGLDAGLLYNESFPLMAGQFIPPDFHQYDTFWHNILDNPSAVQWAHRWLAMFTVLTVLSFWLHAVKRGVSALSIHALAVMAFSQMGLGIITLITHVHLHVAVAHQAGAVILLGLLLMNIRRLKP